MIKKDEMRMTGYPSIDRPWLKYYTEDQMKAELPKCKIFEYVWKQNKDNQDRIALNYYDRKISYGEFFREIEKAAKAFLKIGVRAGDIVAVMAVTLPETIYTFYGLNRIGAIANMIDPRSSTEGIRTYLKETNVRVLVVIDAAYIKAKEAIGETLVQRIIVLSPADSLPPVKKQIYNLTKSIGFKEDSVFIKWRRFIKDGENQEIKDSPYKENECCVIVHTGGTTGNPKGVMLSNDNLNCSAFQGYNTPIDLKREHNWIDIMPPFIAYGVGNGLHLPLITGAEIVLIPAFDPNTFDTILLKYKPVHMIGVPSHYEKIINSKKLDKEDLSYIIAPVVGGDSMPIELEKKVNDFFKKHAGKWNVVKGYGMTEVCAAVSVGVSNESNKIGSVGIPFAHTIISVFDTETGEELTYNQKGEVCMTGPNTMLGYYKNEEETNRILQRHVDGRIWVHSGDLGYIDEDGQLFIEGRLKRIIVRYDGFKVYPNLIEKVLLKNSYVHACCVVGIEDKEHSQGCLPIAYVVLNQQSNDIHAKVMTELYALCNEELPEYAQPKRICFIEQLPLTPIGKVDYRKLEEMAVEA